MTKDENYGIIEADDDVALILPDIRLGRSLGAKWKNYDIELPDGSILNLTEGTIIERPTVIAGKGRNRQIDMVDFLVDKYGGKDSEWQKFKGIGYIDDNGESYKAELHWYQEPTIGKVEWKLKVQADCERLQTTPSLRDTPPQRGIWCTSGVLFL
ncbi:MAG: hypothetical protein FWH48_10990, partial [Oscillospiraceae bacterium]|nr:hypothetical protein [Oscillospiraceae bacterium]